MRPPHASPNRSIVQIFPLNERRARRRGLSGRPGVGALKLLVVALVLFASFSLPLHAQLTLQDAQTKARGASPRLNAVRAATEVALAHERQAASFSNPTLSLGREQTSRGSEQNAQNILAISHSLDYLTGQRSARRAVAELHSERAQRDLVEAEALLDYDVAVAFARVWAGSRRAEIADQGTVAFTEATRVAEARREAGDVSGYEVRRLGLEASRFAAVAATMSLERREAQRELAGLLAIPGRGADTLVVGALLFDARAALGELNVDSLVARALRDRPDLQALELDAAIRDAEARLTSRQRIPVPELSLGYKSERVGDPIEGSRSGFGGYVVSVAIPLPVFNRGEAAVAAANAETRVADARIAEARLRVARDVSDAVDALRAVELQRLALATHLGEEADAALRAVRLSYAEGEISLVEWLDAVRAYQDAQLAFITLQAAEATHHAALRRALGVSSDTLNFLER